MHPCKQRSNSGVTAALALVLQLLMTRSEDPLEALVHTWSRRLLHKWMPGAPDCPSPSRHTHGALQPCAAGACAAGALCLLPGMPEAKAFGLSGATAAPGAGAGGVLQPGQGLAQDVPEPHAVLLGDCFRHHHHDGKGALAYSL